MVTLEDLPPRLTPVGLEPASVTTVAAVASNGNGAIAVFYRARDGTTKDLLLSRDDEAKRSAAIFERLSRLGIRVQSHQQGAQR